MWSTYPGSSRWRSTHRSASSLRPRSGAKRSNSRPRLIPQNARRVVSPPQVCSIGTDPEDPIVERIESVRRTCSRDTGAASRRFRRRAANPLLEPKPSIPAVFARDTAALEAYTAPNPTASTMPRPARGARTSTRGPQRGRQEGERKAGQGGRKFRDRRASTATTERDGRAVEVEQTIIQRYPDHDAANPEMRTQRQIFCYFSRTSLESCDRRGEVMVVEMWAAKTGARHAEWSLPASVGRPSPRPGPTPVSPQRRAAERRRRGAARAAARREAARKLLHAYHKRGDTEARDRLIRQYLPLVRKLARRHVGRGEQLEDLVQVGSIGLINAIDRFQVERGVDLATFRDPDDRRRDQAPSPRPGMAGENPRRLQELDPSFRARATELVEDVESGLEQDGVLEKGYELGEDRAARSPEAFAFSTTVSGGCSTLASSRAGASPKSLERSASPRSTSRGSRDVPLPSCGRRSGTRRR